MTERIFKMKPERKGFTPLEIKISNGRSKKFLTGFTIVELLTVLAIIAILMGILVPTISFVRNTAREAKQRTQLATIDMALMAFKGDYGDYPPSALDERFGTGYYYCGAQKLAEALVGWDLLGFHPESAWRADGYDEYGENSTYDPDGQRDEDSDNVLDTLNERIGPYLEPGSANCFTLKQLFGTTTPTTLALDTYVLCDSFAAKTVTITGTSKTITVKAGRPILYYKAKTDSKTISIGRPDSRIYNEEDNAVLVELNNPVTPDPLLSNFYDDYIIDLKVTAIDWPYRPDSYILISAGVDGLYGTPDDICNF